ncbi:MAG: FAD-dependent oxidoreductase [Nitrospira sp.]|nr:FAD-dependent oxidoreductase [Nitrospira sp.]
MSQAPKAYTVKLSRRQTVAEGTMAFYFDKPTGFAFTPGQFVDVTLPHLPDSDTGGNTRALSIASAPQEPTIMVATRLRETAFKRELQRMPLGTTVQLEGPFGRLALHTDQTRPTVFLSGGIGITPFRSMLVYAAIEGLPQRMLLFYSNRRPEDAPFLEELQALQQQNSRYTFVGTMTEPQKSARPWKGATGFIDNALLSKYLTDADSPVYYVVGPPGMVTALRAMLKAAKVEDRDIRTEQFSGY